MRRQDRLALLYTGLAACGIEWQDAVQLRRISMTLQRWHELECGDSNNYASWCVTRGTRLPKVNGKENFHHNDEGKPYLERHPYDGMVSYSPIPDRERGAQRRLAKIMAKYPGLTAYVQGDPRGAALYILRPGDVPEGGDVSASYSRGIAVYRQENAWAGSRSPARGLWEGMEGSEMARFPGWRHMTGVQRRNERMHAIFERARELERERVIRYVATYVNREGMRTLMSAAQGRNTFATKAGAQAWIDAVSGVNSSETIRQIWGDDPRCEVRACPCYPGHFDPETIWFDN